MLIEIQAKFSCDDCGTEFSVTVDPALVMPTGWSVFDVAEDAVRGGFGYEDAHEPRSSYVGMVEDDRHLCGRCAEKLCKNEKESE